MIAHDSGAPLEAAEPSRTLHGNGKRDAACDQLRRGFQMRGAVAGSTGSALDTPGANVLSSAQPVGPLQPCKRVIPRRAAGGEKGAARQRLWVVSSGEVTCASVAQAARVPPSATRHSLRSRARRPSVGSPKQAWRRPEPHRLQTGATPSCICPGPKISAQHLAVPAPNYHKSRLAQSLEHITRVGHAEDGAAMPP